MGIRVHRDRLDHAMAVRGLTGRELAALAGVTRKAMSRARRGQPVTPATFAKLAEALTRVPVVIGAERLVALV